MTLQEDSKQEYADVLAQYLLLVLRSIPLQEQEGRYFIKLDEKQLESGSMVLEICEQVEE